MSKMKTYTAQELLSKENNQLLNEICLTIALSFLEDPNTLYIFNSHDRKSLVSSLHFSFGTLVKAALVSDARLALIGDEDTQPSSGKAPYQKLPCTSPIRCVGILVPPGNYPKLNSLWTFIRSGGLFLPFKTGFQPLYKFVTEQGPVMEAMHKRVFGDISDHWYLVVLATHPDAQGQGLGGRMLKEFQRAAVEAVEGQNEKVKPIYLESSSRGSQRLYRRCGFVDCDEYTYGKIEQGEDVVRDGKGRVIGGRAFGMIWTHSD